MQWLISKDTVSKIGHELKSSFKWLELFIEDVMQESKQRNYTLS